MHPTLCPGDIVIYRSISKKDLFELKGKIVVIRHPVQEKNLIIKRVKDEYSLGLEVRGDNSFSSTDSRQFGLVNKANIVGLVECVLYKNPTYIIK